jgi:hypothetical protein
MKRSVSVALLTWSVGASLLLAVAAHAQTVRWVGKVDGARPEILHAPDTRCTSVDPPVLLSDFGSGFRYTGLARLLGVARSELARADVIAFEGNGGSPGGAGPEQGNGWESSIWTFSDGMTSYTVHFNERDSPSSYGPPTYPAVVANGSLRGPDGTFLTGNVTYRRFLKTC